MRLLRVQPHCYSPCPWIIYSCWQGDMYSRYFLFFWCSLLCAFWPLTKEMIGNSMRAYISFIYIGALQGESIQILCKKKKEKMLKRPFQIYVYYIQKLFLGRQIIRDGASFSIHTIYYIPDNRRNVYTKYMSNGFNSVRAPFENDNFYYIYFNNLCLYQKQ